MITVDLITGFLGAGKTVFIHKYSCFLREKGEKLFLVENEFGSIGVDAGLLKNDVETIGDLSGKCMCCRGYEEFRMMLIGAAQEGYDRILVEPSGIYDVDEFFAIMDDPMVKNHCRIGNIITIVDPEDYKNWSKETEYLAMCQILASGIVVLSRTQECEKALQEETVRRLGSLLQIFHAGRELTETEICRKNWMDFQKEDFEKIASCGYHQVNHEKQRLVHDLLYSSIFFPVRMPDKDSIAAAVQDVLSNPRYGTILRIKGYAREQSGIWYEVNCTRNACSIREVQIKRGLMVVIGQDLKEERIRERFLI